MTPHTISNNLERDSVISLIEATAYPFNVEVTKPKRQRTLSQNNAIWLFCELLSEHLNLGDWGMKVIFEIKDQDVDWTKNAVMDALWRPLQLEMFRTVSTTELEVMQVSNVHETLMQKLGESKRAIPYLEFPSEERL